MESKLKNEQKAMYEIFRACRLCGAGGGYKIPIIANLPLHPDQEVDLKQKILDCVQIDVRQDDRMPPLICELCLDKINDYYEFLEMCRQTNRRTRLRLGLPLHSAQESSDSCDCILGITEPVYVNDEDSNDEQPLQQFKKDKNIKKPAPAMKIAKEPKVVLTRTDVKITNLKQIQMEKYPTRKTLSKQQKPEPSPKRTTRQSGDEDKQDLQLKEKEKPIKAAPKGILKKEVKVKKALFEVTKPSMSSKRKRVTEPAEDSPPPKKVKISSKPIISKSEKARSIKSERAIPIRTEKVLDKRERWSLSKIEKCLPKRASRTPSIKVERASPIREDPMMLCDICHSKFARLQALISHRRHTHLVTFTNPKQACDACQDWYPSVEAATSHHRWHRNRPYSCRMCTAEFKHYTGYQEHIECMSCIPSVVLAEVKCEDCWGHFHTQTLLDEHRCPGVDGRPGGNCYRCRRWYATLSSKKKHEATCTAKEKGYKVSAELKSRMRPIQVRMVKCDSLLNHMVDNHFIVTNFNPVYGLDKSCIYPYSKLYGSVRVKCENKFDGMVNINDEFLDYDDAFVHWDSDSDDSSVNSFPNPFNKRRKVDSLSRLALKKIFSKELLGKVPKKRRKIKSEIAKAESLLDSLLKDDDDSDKSEDKTQNYNSFNEAKDSEGDSGKGAEDELVSSQENYENSEETQNINNDDNNEVKETDDHVEDTEKINSEENDETKGLVKDTEKSGVDSEKMNSEEKEETKETKGLVKDIEESGVGSEKINNKRKELEIDLVKNTEDSEKINNETKDSEVDLKDTEDREQEAMNVSFTDVKEKTYDGQKRACDDDSEVIPENGERDDIAEKDAKLDINGENLESGEKGSQEPMEFEENRELGIDVFEKILNGVNSKVNDINNDIMDSLDSQLSNALNNDEKQLTEEEERLLLEGEDVKVNDAVAQKHHSSMDLDNVSDDDINFDA